MQQDILINWSPQETRVAVVESGAVQELHVERALERGLADIHEGRAQRLAAPFPSEVQPLGEEFNRVLDHNAEIVTRARTQAGNLAHALKTPLAVLSQAAEAAQRAPGANTELPALVPVLERWQADG